MNTIYFATTNKDKVQIAQSVCAGAGVIVNPVGLDINEIQGEDSELIVRDKARRAYDQLGAPVAVSDDTWDIKALNGFPGAYMKSINYWFTPDDFLRLMYGVQDRTIILHQYLAFTDGNVTEVFKNDISGKMLDAARGTNKKSPNMTVIALDSDNGKSIAEVHDLGANALEARYKKQPDAWHGFIEWFREG